MFLLYFLLAYLAVGLGIAIFWYVKDPGRCSFIRYIPIAIVWFLFVAIWMSMMCNAVTGPRVRLAVKRQTQLKPAVQH